MLPVTLSRWARVSRPDTSSRPGVVVAAEDDDEEGPVDGPGDGSSRMGEAAASGCRECIASEVSRPEIGVDMPGGSLWSLPIFEIFS